MSRKRWGMLVALLAAFVFAFSATPLLGGSPPDFAPAHGAKDRHVTSLIGIDGVVAVGVGLTPSGVPGVIVFTARAGVGGIPPRVDKVPVAVRVTGPIVARDHKPKHNPGGDGGGEPDPKTRFDRPVPIGVSSGNENDFFLSFPFIFCSGGTYGMRLTDGTGVHALSNNHVYGRENQAAIGENILQPGLNDTNCSGSADDIMGQVSAVVPIIFNNTETCDGTLADSDCNKVDAAMAGSTTALIGNATPSNGYGTPNSASVAAVVGQAVQKYGRTTSLTNGTVIAVNVTVDVGYDSRDRAVRGPDYHQ